MLGLLSTLRPNTSQMCSSGHSLLFQKVSGNTAATVQQHNRHELIQRGDQGSRHPLKIHKAIGYLSNIGQDPLENHKSYPARIQCWAFIGRPRNAIKWCFAGPLLVSSFPSSAKKTKQKNVKVEFTGPPSGKTFWIRV